ncbi:restriction endonuclease [Superficieibacter electus]|uniref:Restriction endonuclease n=1 Tax=Superficieibacter electus TaxID=2022662 RepID=A0A2P5GQJ7_9ENTR|nr:restriction endonuclease subunit S [Superficieibacter electus]POP45653.1 restriction endonuclease [Superficieibacter electus]POP48814.1 restriction endonuclease [Superficieibacter electus]
MGSNWVTVSIDDIKSPEKYSCVGGPFGSSLSQKHYVDSGVPVIRGTNLTGDIFSESGFVFVSPDKANELQRNMAFRGDIVFTQRGTLGQVALIPEDSIYERYIVSQSQMKLTVNPKQADAYFIYTYFRTNEAKALIENNAIVGGVPHINLGILKEFKLRLPPLSDQKRISEVSKSIDNKINLNCQINQTLEQMSQTLFKSWFVDFDPVIDNALDAGNPIPEALQSRAELRQKVRNSADFKPLPADIRALFPAEFEEIELGWVPKGWITTSFNDLIELIGGGTPKTSVEEYWNGDIPWFSVVDAPNESDVYVLNTEKNITTEGLNNSSAKLLRKGTTIISARGTVGKCTMVAVPMAMNQSCYGVNGKNNISDEYVYFQLKNAVQTLQQMGHGSVFNTITRDTFKNIKIPFCNEELTNSFSLLVKNYFSKILNNNYQNIALTALRDTLLPKIISGELSLEALPNLVAQTEPA